uniref:uncharacterized protein LOC105349534 isoform X3 n=1 Tax=Fragaria vesca subsp. vesca TaxID=101020 RepID=UPI0005C866AD|nr:PREDICTED: uncharacterized protein LOC105349534 isoform X3 [Fragaria vesca subsp. vesca]
MNAIHAITKEAYYDYVKEKLMQWFRFVDFDRLHMRENNDTVLTDLIGRLKLVYPLEEAFIEGRRALKRLLYIQDARRQDLKLTLWGTLAFEFDVDMIKTLPPPVVMAFTSTKVRCFDNTIVNSGMSTCMFINPAIPEIEEYRANFNKLYHAPKFITTSSARHELAPDYRCQDIINVCTLNLQAGNKDKSLTFICKAKITKFMVQRGWYYLACPTCCKTLRLDHNCGKLCCGNHGVDWPSHVKQRTPSLE